MKFYKYSLLLITLLSGCAPKVAEWTPAESPKKNKIERAYYTHTIHYSSKGIALGDAEKKKLLQFLKPNAPRPSAVVVTLEENGAHSQKRIKGIQRELVRYGIAYNLISVEQVPSACKGKKGAPSDVNLFIEYFLVIPPSCADFSQPIGSALQEYTHSNFGCADTANLGIMVANPRDLIDGRPVGVSDGTVMAAGVNRYRTDTIKQLQETETNVTPTQSEESGTAATTQTSGVGY